MRHLLAQHPPLREFNRVARQQPQLVEISKTWDGADKAPLVVCRKASPHKWTVELSLERKNRGSELTMIAVFTVG
jgi:hypothetical protein